MCQWVPLAMAGVRPFLTETDMARLPAAEQKEWQALWTEVEITFAKAESLAR